MVVAIGIIVFMAVGLGTIGVVAVAEFREVADEMAARLDEAG